MEAVKSASASFSLLFVLVVEVGFHLKALPHSYHHSRHTWLLSLNTHHTRMLTIFVEGGFIVPP